MSAPVRVCRWCDGVIAHPDSEGVIVAHELGNSGPGWDVWAHREHADQVDVIGDDVLRIMLRIWEHQGR